MMMTHRIVLKTHPLLTTHVRSVRSILLRCLINDEAPPKGEGRCWSVRMRPLGAGCRTGSSSFDLSCSCEALGHGV
jgi:hypothetical protein